MVRIDPRGHFGWQWLDSAAERRGPQRLALCLLQVLLRPAAWRVAAHRAGEGTVPTAKQFAQSHRGEERPGAHIPFVPLGWVTQTSDTDESSPCQGPVTSTKHMFCRIPIFPTAPFRAPFLGKKGHLPVYLLLERHFVPAPHDRTGRGAYPEPHLCSPLLLIRRRGGDPTSPVHALLSSIAREAEWPARCHLVPLNYFAWL